MPVSDEVLDTKIMTETIFHLQLLFLIESWSCFGIMCLNV